MEAKSTERKNMRERIEGEEGRRKEANNNTYLGIFMAINCA
jgi:hypothetical protein